MRGKTGFTLVEIVLAMALLASVFVAVASFVVTTRQWSKGKTVKSAKLELSAIGALSAESRKLRYSGRDSIASSVSSDVVSQDTDVTIYRLRPALDGVNRNTDAPVLAFAIAKEK